MLSKVFKVIILIMMILNGLLFISNIYVLGDREAAIKMHNDLAPSASALTANIKVIDCFVSGILYLSAAVGIIRRKYSWALAGVVAFVIFDGLYIIELVMWAKNHPRIWIDFSTFGGLSLLIGGYSWWTWKKKSLV